MLYFLVYNDNTHNIHMDRLLKSVQEYGKEFEIIIFNRSDIDAEFMNKNKDILDLQRGSGYWLWKPYIINKTLEKIKDGDIIFYLDSKYYFLEKFQGLYKDYMKNNDLLIWKNKPNWPIFYMKNWCKMDVILKYNMFDKIFREHIEDSWAGALVIKKSEKTIKFIQDWLDMSSIYEDITDSESKNKNIVLFNEHRHDQSLLSILVHKNNIPLQFFENKYLQNVRNPFLV